MFFFKNITKNKKCGVFVEKEIDLKKLVNVLLIRKWTLMMITIAFAAIGFLFSDHSNTSYYTASARILIKDDGKMTGTLLAMIKEPIVLNDAVKQLKLNETPEELSSQINVEPIGESQIVNISVTDTSPVTAAQKTNAVINAFQEDMPKLLNFNQIRILSKADDKIPPSSSSPLKTILLAGAVGLIISIGIIFLLDSLDDSIRTAQEAEKLLGIPVLGTVSKANRRNAPINKKSKLNAIVRGESVADYK